MKQTTLLLLAFFIAVVVFSQDNPDGPTYVQKAVYFDKTPPLRDMPIIMPGERDRSWKDNIIPNESLFEEKMHESVRNNPNNAPDGAIQTNRSSRGVTGPLLNFDGVGNVSGVYPPDTDGDVGPDHYFQMINLAYAIWDKNGNKLYGPVDNSTLWQGFIGPWTGTNDGDPIVMYDELADRWVATQFAINTSNGTYWELIAVSETGDPLGSYYRYAFQFFAFNDYPKMAIWPDGYYFSFNMFGSYTRVGVAALERDKMLVGDPNANMVYFDRPAGTFGMLPSDFDGTPPPTGAPCYYAHLLTSGNHNLEIYEFDVDWNNTSNSTFTLKNTLSPTSYNSSLNGISQPGTSTKLDDLAFFLMNRLQYRNFGSYETLVTNHTVNHSSKAGVRWYEMRKTASDWSIYQQSTYSPDGENRWMGSAAMNGNGDIAIGYSVSSSSVYPSIRYTARRAGDPLGQMTFAEIELVSGLSSQSGISRWGDYACMSVDPVDDSTFWFTQEYRKASGWGTRISSFDLSPLMPPTVDVGPNDTVCEEELYNTNAVVTSQSSVLWTTTGDGIFQNASSVNTFYLRGNDDIINGEVQLKLTAQGYEPNFVASDSLIVYIDLLPEAFAGNDTLYCIGETLLLAGATASNYDSLLWTTNGDGTFDDDILLNAIYTAGPGDISAGNVVLSLTAKSLECADDPDTDDIFVTVDECTGVNEANAEKIGLKVIPNPNNGLFNISVSSDYESDVTMKIFSVEGQNVFTFRLGKINGSYTNTINMSNYPKGVYFVTVENGRGSETVKFVTY